MTTRLFGFQNEYDEEQGRERYLQYLRSAQKNSALKESVEFGQPLTLEQAPDRPITEILNNEAELSQVLQQRLSQLLEKPDAKPRGVNETDDSYDSRVSPVQFVLSRLTREQMKLILTNFAQILADTKDVKMLPIPFLTYIDAYQRRYAENGGVRGYPDTSRIVAEIRAIRNVAPNNTNVEQLLNTLTESQRVFRQDIATYLRLTSQTKLGFIAKFDEIINRLNALNNVTAQIDYDRITEAVNAGSQEVINEGRLLSGDLYHHLIEALEHLPTNADLTRLNTKLTRNINQIVAQVNEGSIRSNADKAEILTELQNSLNTIDALLVNKVNTQDLDGIHHSLNDIYGLVEDTARQTVRETQRQIQKSVHTQQPIQETPYYDAVKRRAEELGENPEAPEVQVRLLREAILAKNTGRLPERDPQPKGARPTAGRGYGNLAKSNRHPKYSTVVGRGIKLSEEPKYVEFGKFILSLPKFEKNVLDVKYVKSGARHQQLNNIQISDELQEIINNYIDTRKLNTKMVKKLESAEKNVLSKLINGSGLVHDFKIEHNENEKKENERFEMLKGIYLAGNDNPEILKEFKHLLMKFISDGRIDKYKGLEVLYELNKIEK